MKKYLFILSVLVIGLASCSKNDATPQPPFDAAAQAKIDDDAIKAYLVAHPTITAVKDLNHPELYYQVLQGGSGDPLTDNSQIVVSYVGTNLKDAVFQSTDSFSFKLSQDLIAGFKIAVSKLKNGGKILVIIPSALGYGPYANGPLPPNSVLIFTITIKSVDGQAPVVDPT